MNIDEQIEILEAYRDGRQIEVRRTRQANSVWHDNKGGFNFNKYEYRIKQMPTVIYLWADKFGKCTSSTDEFYRKEHEWEKKIKLTWFNDDIKFEVIR